MRKTQDFSAGYVLCSSDHSAIETQRPRQCRSKCTYPNWMPFSRHTRFSIFVFFCFVFLDTAYQNGRIKWRKVWCIPFNSHLSAFCDSASCTHSLTDSQSQHSFTDLTSLVFFFLLNQKYFVKSNIKKKTSVMFACCIFLETVYGLFSSGVPQSKIINMQN